MDLQGLGAVWQRDYSSVLRIPPCSLPGMATFVSPNKPNFRVTSLKDPTPLISYHLDSWTPSASSRETRASVIRKTSDVTTS